VTIRCSRTRIVSSRAQATAAKLVRAGASRVISPYLIGGARVVQAILQPAVLDFVEVAMKSDGEPMTFNPPDGTRIAPGSTLVMLGARHQLDRVEEVARR
jgi:voltage-gated potassium channel